jgi:ankyrin repeat protein
MFEIISDPTLNEHQKCQAILKLLEKNPDDLFSCNLGMTALHYAANENLPEVIKLLLKKGLSVNSLGLTKNTALHIAAERGHDKLIFLLGYHECNFNALDINNQSALEKAIDRKHPDCVKNLLLASKFQISDEIKSQAWKSLEQMSDFKSQHTLANAFNTQPDPFGRTPLHLAVLENSVELVQFLISSGADINEKDKLGLTALHFAAQGGHKEIILLLRCQDNINMNAVDNNGNSALHLGVEHPHCVHLLVSGKNRTDKSIKNYVGKTAEELILSNPEALREALSIKKIDQVDKDFIHFEKKIPINCVPYLRKNFKELLSDNEGFHDGPTSKFFKQKIRKTTSMFIQNSPELSIFEKPSLANDWIRDKNMSFYQKIYLTKNVKALLKTITIAAKKGDLVELMRVLNGFIETYPDEQAVTLLLSALDELQPLLLEEQTEFYSQLKSLQNAFCTNLLADGLDEFCSLETINKLTSENLSKISPNADSTKKLQKLTDICSGDFVKERTEIKIDLYLIRIRILGLMDFVEPVEIISLLIKLVPLLSTIQRLQCHFIVFSMVEFYNLYGYEDQEIKLFNDEVNLYFNTFCNKELREILEIYRSNLDILESKSYYAANELIKAFLADKIELQKESIHAKIDCFVNRKHRSSGTSIIVDITREINNINAKLYQQKSMLKEFRLECMNEKKQLNPGLLEQSNLFNSISTWIQTTVSSYPTAAQQAQAITLFIRVAQGSLLNPHGPNMFIAMAFVCALSSSEIGKLKTAFALVDKNILKIQTLLFELLSYNKNFENYRNLLKEDYRALPIIDRIIGDKLHFYEQIELLQSDEILYENLEAFGKLNQSLCLIKQSLRGISLDSKTDLPELLQGLNVDKKIDFQLKTPKILISLPKKGDILSSTESSSQEDSTLNRRSSEKKSSYRKLPLDIISSRKISSEKKISPKDKDCLKSSEFSSGYEISPRNISPQRKMSTEKEPSHSTESSLGNELSPQNSRRVTWFGSTNPVPSQKIDLAKEIDKNSDEPFTSQMK